MSKSSKYIAVIANNYGKHYDGIGAFSEVITSFFSEQLLYDVYTSSCSENNSKIYRCFTFGMTSKILGCVKRINKYQGILIEYPFVEWNPMIIIGFLFLKSKSQKNGVKIILSLHEFERVNILRKKVIEYLAKHSDLVIVSNQKMKMNLLRYNNNIAIREIPTNIFGKATPKKKESINKYVFFGLINGTKAFDEMLEGWDRFNDNQESYIYVITGSKKNGLEKHKNVIYIHNAENDKVFDIMNKCMYCVLPVKPLIDEKNATFKTGTIAGCICIGKFSERFSKENFIINLNKYTANEFYDAFMKTKAIDYEDAKERSKESILFGEKYSPEKIAETVENIVLKELN